MKILRAIFLTTLLITSTFLAGCGGGGGGGGNPSTAGILSVSAVVSGSQIIATAKYSNSAFTNLSGLKIDFSTNQPGLVLGTTVATDDSGTAVAVLNIVGIPSASTVNVMATTGGLVASSAVALSLPGLSLSLNSATISLGTPVVATAVYTNPQAGSLKGVPIVFSSSNAALFDPITVLTDDTGTAVAVMVPKNTITAQTNVTIYAKRDTQTQTASLSVKPESLTVTAPANAEKTITAGVAGDVVRFVPSGVESFGVLTSGDGLPLAGKNVTIGISTIINQTPGDLVTFWINYPSTPSTGTSITLPTDSTGHVPNQTTVDVVIPGPGGTHIITVVWKVTYNSPSGQLVGYASTQYTVTNNAPPLAVSPATQTFANTDGVGTTKTYTVTGGVGPYSATSNNTGLVTVAVSGGTVVATRAGAGIGNVTITVTDSAGTSIPVQAVLQ